MDTRWGRTAGECVGEEAVGRFENPSPRPQKAIWGVLGCLKRLPLKKFSLVLFPEIFGKKNVL